MQGTISLRFVGKNSCRIRNAPCSENFFSEQVLRRLDTLTRIYDQISYRLRALLLPFLVNKGRVDIYPTGR